MGVLGEMLVKVLVGMQVFVLVAEMLVMERGKYVVGGKRPHFIMFHRCEFEIGVEAEDADVSWYR